MIVNILWPFAILAIVLWGATDLHLAIFATSYIGMVSIWESCCLVESLANPFTP